MVEAPALLHAKTLTLHWHDNSLPVYTIDFQPNRKGLRSNRLATGGGDNNVRIWKLVYNEDETEVASVEYLSTLAKHTQAVNCVRFDPTGEMLATASDDGTIMIWCLSDKIIKEFGSDDDDLKESWYLKTSCRSSSSSEIYDISWSPDSKYICCGSMDNITRVYNVANGLIIKQISEHNHYVQGVSWDPRNEYICSQSADRSVHIYKILSERGNEFNLSPTTFYKIQRAELPSSKLSHFPNKHPFTKLTSENLAEKNHKDSSSSSSCSSCPATTPASGLPMVSPTPVVAAAPSTVSSISTMDPPQQTPRHKRTYSNSSTSSTHSMAMSITRCSSPAAAPLPAVMPPSPSIVYKNFQLYHNETLQSFFRRLSFSPDGLLLFTSSGIYKNQQPDANSASGASEELINTVYVHTRFGLNRPPVAHLPGFRKPAIAIRFSPIIYKPIQGEMSAFKLNYRMVFAVATQDSVLIYDTQRLKALGIVANVHYAVITDICWSSDGKVLMVSSADGFASSVIVDQTILGEVETTDIAKFLKDNPLIKPEPKKPEAKIVEAKKLPPVEPPTPAVLLFAATTGTSASIEASSSGTPKKPQKASNAPSILDMLRASTGTTIVHPTPIQPSTSSQSSTTPSTKAPTPSSASGSSAITRTPTPSAAISKLTENNDIEVIDITDAEDNREEDMISVDLSEQKDIAGPLELTDSASAIIPGSDAAAVGLSTMAKPKKKRRIAPTLVTTSLDSNPDDGKIEKGN